jgi:RsiW-degrading membrane proteinase PrsW (M82 family)
MYNLGFVFGSMIATPPAYLLIANILTPNNNIWALFVEATQLYVTICPLESVLMLIYTLFTIVFLVFVFHGIYKRALISQSWSDFVLMWVMYGLFLLGIVCFFSSVSSCDVICAFPPNVSVT